MKQQITKQEFLNNCQKVFEINQLSTYADNDRLELLYEMTAYMLEVNAVMNLTAITDPKEIIVKHLADSIAVAPYIPNHAKILDVGCGGGFPSLPLAIVRPDIHVTALDSTAKKTEYVLRSADRLKLNNLSTVTGRAEELAHDTRYREQFDATTARAVSSLPILAEICLPFIKVGGTMLALKGRQDAEEITNAVLKLGGSPYRIYSFNLMGNGLEEARCVISSEKKTHTSGEYPRVYAQIKKNPLI